MSGFATAALLCVCLRLIPRAASTVDLSGPSRGYINYNPLRGLDPLPKLHYAYPFPNKKYTPHHINFWNSDPTFLGGLMADFVRVTGSCPINTPALACWTQPSCQRKYPEALEEFRNMTVACIELCHAVRESRVQHGLPPAALHLSMNPWQNPNVWPAGAAGNDPALAGAVERNYVSNMTAVLDVVAELCREHGGKIQAALIDAERFLLKTPARCSSAHMRNAITRKHDLLFNTTRDFFPGADIFRFQRGRLQKFMTLGEISLYGDDMRDCPVAYTGAEQGTDFNIALYQVQEIEAMRENFRRTVRYAMESNMDSVTPWIALGERQTLSVLTTRVRILKGVCFCPGCGYAREASRAHPIAFSNSNTYPAVYSWELGGEVNNASYSSTPTRAADFANWSWAKQVVLFPSPFETTKILATGTANHSSTNVFDHFIAYTRGATGLDGIKRTTKV
jgi:hypothetical protein